MTNITLEEFWIVVLETGYKKYLQEVNCSRMKMTLLAKYSDFFCSYVCKQVLDPNPRVKLLLHLSNCQICNFSSHQQFYERKLFSFLFLLMRITCKTFSAWNEIRSLLLHKFRTKYDPLKSTWLLLTTCYSQMLILVI